MMNPRLRAIAILVLLIAAAFITYYYSLTDVPRRDHSTYLTERVLVDSDWDWFWYSISYSRTRFLYPGDYFLFRPLHMAVVALKDIFLRKNLFALGAINIITMAVAAFSLYFFSSKLLKPLAAIIVALLFMVQYAGLEIVAWGHINPYLLALVFFGFAMSSMLEAGPENKAALKKAGAFLLLGALVHEMVVVALVLAVPFFGFIRWQAGKTASIGGVPLRSYVMWIVAMPILIYIGLDLSDYLYRGAHPLFGTSGDFSTKGTLGLLGPIFTVAGASAVAFLAPFKVTLAMGKLGLLAWDFESMRSAILAIGAVLSLALMPALYECIRAMKAGSSSKLAIPALLVLLLFIGILLGIGLGRVYSRGNTYLHGATYNYAITAYIFCLLIAFGLYHLDKIREKKIPLFLFRAVLAVMVLLIAVNFMKTHATVRNSFRIGKPLARMYPMIEKSLAEHSQRNCLAGILPGRVEIYTGLYLQLFREQTCQVKDGRIPAYMVASADGSLWLAELETEPFGAFGKPEKVPLVRISPDFALSRSSYERPDIALTVHNKSRVLLMLGFQSVTEYFGVGLNGPLLYWQVPTTVEKHAPRGAPLPHVSSSQRLEVRHGTDSIYFFVDGHLVATSPDSEERPGKIGVMFKIDGDTNQAFSDLLVAPSAPRGAEPVDFKPVVRLLKSPDFATP